MVNYLAILVAAIVSQVIGMLWYSPALFGKKWMKLSGVKMKKGEPMGGKMLTALISGLVMAYVISMFLELTGAAATFSAGAIVAFWLWLGFIGTTTLGSVLWERKPSALWVLNNAYNLLNLVIMAGIIAIWP